MASTFFDVTEKDDTKNVRFLIQYGGYDKLERKCLVLEILQYLFLLTHFKLIRHFSDVRVYDFSIRVIRILYTYVRLFNAS